MIINDDQKDWADKCPMVEFVLNSSISAITGFALFKLNQGHMPQIRMPTLFDTPLKGVKQFTLQAKWDLMVAHDMIIANWVQQTFHPNKKCHTSDLYHVGDHMYLSTQNLTLPKGRARKLVPKYIGPYKIVKAHNEASTVMLELPPALIAQQISPIFHMGLIQSSLLITMNYFLSEMQNHSMILAKTTSKNGLSKRLHLTTGRTQKSLNLR